MTNVLWRHAGGSICCWDSLPTSFVPGIGCVVLSVAAVELLASSLILGTKTCSGEELSEGLCIEFSSVNCFVQLPLAVAEC